jgi:hypothetical protein
MTSSSVLHSSSAVPGRQAVVCHPVLSADSIGMRLAIALPQWFGEASHG